MSINRLAQLKAFLAESPNDPFLTYAMSLEYLKTGEDEKALDIFMKLTKTNPNYVGTYYHLGKLQEKQEMYEEALVTYEKGMEIANQLKDYHSLKELKGAYNMLSDELEDW